MAATTSITLGTLINETLDSLYSRGNERPQVLVVGADALTEPATDTTLTLSSGTAEVTEILENGLELLLVTAKSTDAIPVYTVSRGYLGTTRAAAATGATLNRNPVFERYKVRRALLRAFKRALPANIPYVRTQTITRKDGDDPTLNLPTDVLRPLRLAYVDENDRWREAGNWTFVDDAPQTFASNGKAIVGLRAPVSIKSFHLTYQALFQWNLADADPAETAAITLPEYMLDLPSMFAAAYVVARREISRLELDRVEEWNTEAAIRQGVNLRMVQSLWAEFYRAVDEARSVATAPKHRPFIKMPR